MMNSKAEILFDEATYNKLVVDLKASTGVGLVGYRRGVAQRRISRRARNVGCLTLADYLNYFRRDSSEPEKLASLVTLPVSKFFRNKDVFDAIAERVLPQVFDKARKDEKIFIWCAGCGEGEEVYSIAITLKTQFENELDINPCSIIGTDVNLSAVEKAGAGVYDEKRLEEVPPSIKHKFFGQTDGGWSINREIRQMVAFRREALPEGRGVGKAHLVMLRNLLIYFDRDRQELILDKVVKCVKRDGFLVLGKSETLPGRFREMLDTVSAPQRIYRKVP